MDLFCGVRIFLSYSNAITFHEILKLFFKIWHQMDRIYFPKQELCQFHVFTF